jgi:hypothetical protein
MPYVPSFQTQQTALDSVAYTARNRLCLNLFRSSELSRRTASSQSRQPKFVQMFATCKNCRKFILTPFWVIQIAKFVILKDLHRGVSFAA